MILIVMMIAVIMFSDYDRYHYDSDCGDDGDHDYHYYHYDVGEYDDGDHDCHYHYDYVCDDDDVDRYEFACEYSLDNT